MDKPDAVSYSPIGIIRSPYTQKEGMPIQGAFAEESEGHIELDPHYSAGLKDLEGFSHLILLYHFHLSDGYSLRATPFLDDTARGVFAIRAPRRPNPIGLSVVRLRGIEGNVVHIDEVDVLDQTPLLDIKPYVTRFDCRPGACDGWVQGKTENTNRTVSDDRFSH